MKDASQHAEACNDDMEAKDVPSDDGDKKRKATRKTLSLEKPSKKTNRDKKVKPARKNSEYQEPRKSISLFSMFSFRTAPTDNNDNSRLSDPDGIQNAYGFKNPFAKFACKTQQKDV